MRYYFHILKDRERIRDHDGEEFESLASATDEATQSARDLIAEELRCGRVAPSEWRIQIALEDDTILAMVPFAPLLLGSNRRRAESHRSAQELLAQANATFARARTTTVEIRQHLEELRSGIATLGRLHKAFTQHRRG